MAKCGRCGTFKADEAFGFRFKQRGIRHSVCRVCQRDYRRTYDERIGSVALHARVREHTERYRDRNRLFLDAYLAEHPCVDCGEADIVVLEFDHVRGTKKRALSVLVKHASSLDVLRAEIAKCDVRCANCHRRRTARFHHRRRARLRSVAAGPDLSVVRIDLDDGSQNG